MDMKSGSTKIVNIKGVRDIGLQTFNVVEYWGLLVMLLMRMGGRPADEKELCTFYIYIVHRLSFIIFLYTW